MVHPITLKTKEDVLRLNDLATKENFNLKVSTGSIIIDAKSLLALFTILGKEVHLTVPDHVEVEKFSKFIKKLSKK
jgi:hypothetical protein